MNFSPTDLTTYTNKQASDFLSNALSRLGCEALGFESNSEAFSKLGKIFWVKPNTIKNDRDSFDPYYPNQRKGWHQPEELKPGLKKIKDYADPLTDQELIDTCNSLRQMEWLPDLKKAFDASKTYTSQSERQLVSYFELTDEAIAELKGFLESEESLDVVSVCPSALTVKTRQQAQTSILNFAYIPRLIGALDYLEAADAYIQKFAKAREVLLEKVSVIDSSVGTQVTKQKTDQKLFEYLKSADQDDATILKALVSEFNNHDTATKMLSAATDNSWGLNHGKCFFRSRSDIMNSLCCSLLNFENNVVNIAPLTNFILWHPEPSRLMALDVTKKFLEEQTGGPRNMLLFGAPGTGKSFSAETLVDCNKGHLHKTVFFSEYQNTDFVGSLRPSISEDGVTYRFVPGPLTNAWVDALQHPDQPVVLIVDELNRGNAPSIFGEAFQLLDRDESGASQYQINLPEEVAKHIAEQTGRSASDGVVTKRYGFPSNFYIVGTMNSADQGVFPLDTAFKRRWNFRYLPIDFSRYVAQVGFSNPSINIGKFLVNWVDFATAINALLEKEGIAEDRFLGPFFLSPTELKSDSLTEVMAQKVLPYLWEDVLKLGDERSILFDTDAFTSFTALQSAFLRGENVFNADMRDEIGDEHSSVDE